MVSCEMILQIQMGDIALRGDCERIEISPNDSRDMIVDVLHAVDEFAWDGWRSEFSLEIKFRGDSFISACLTEKTQQEIFDDGRRLSAVLAVKRHLGMDVVRTIIDMAVPY